MSVANGFKDILIRVQDEVCLVDGLSPKGHEWVNRHLASVTTPKVSKGYLGMLVQLLLADRLSVEIR